MNFDEKLKYAMNYCNRKFNANANFFFKIYPFATEVIASYIKDFTLQNKSLLTVGSSGDQALNAIYYDCSDIVLYDINPFTRYYFYLKSAAIQCLTYEEFITFFFDENEPCNYNLFVKLANCLCAIDDESYAFWLWLFAKFNGKTVRNNLFMGTNRNEKLLKACNVYLKSANDYKLLSSKIAGINPLFLEGSIYEGKLPRSFDNVFLSNLTSYYALSKHQLLLKKIDKKLNINGKVLVGYLYNANNELVQKEWQSLINGEDNRAKFNNYEFITKYFLGMQGYLTNNSDIQDMALIYKKTR